MCREPYFYNNKSIQNLSINLLEIFMIKCLLDTTPSEKGPLINGSVSESGTGSLDSQSRGPVPDPEPILQGLSRGPVVHFSSYLLDNIIKLS